MYGNTSHYNRGEFEIERVDGGYLGLPPSRYCYELRFRGRLVRRFEYQHEARTYFDGIYREYQEVSKRREEEEREFASKYNLSSFPKSFDT